jgi:enterochelin esterase-like enzyme
MHEQELTAVSDQLKDAMGCVTLRVYLDVGRNDSLAPGVEAFAAALEAHDLKPAFHLYPGEHNRTYWRAHTAEYLAFYAAGW